MKNNHPTGLGDPEPEGKLALFQPPQTTTRTDENPQPKNPPNTSQGKSTSQVIRAIDNRRIRTTIDLTRDALEILQNIQQEHRLNTGKVLPLWKAVSEAITFYGKSNEGLNL